MTMARRTGGYTLVELIVSIALFSIVMLIVMAAYLAIISLDRQARAGSQLVSSLSFALDSMSRTIRTGTGYTGGGTTFSFTDSTGQAVTYRLGPGTQKSIAQCMGTGCTDVTLTDPKITITTLNFIVRGAASSDGVQPQVTIIAKGTMQTDAGRTTSFSIQTGATQRLIDL